MKEESKHYRAFSCMLIIYSLLIISISPINTSATPVPANSVNHQTKRFDDNKSVANNSAYFEENTGQFDERVKYFARGTNGYNLFLTATEAVYILNETKKIKNNDNKFNALTTEKKQTLEKHRNTSVFMKLVGANKNANAIGLQKAEHKTNYFKGDESDWHKGIENFKSVRITDVYEGIDTVWYGKDNGEVQYDFIVQPNVNPNQIEWEIEGADSIEIDKDGSLLIKTKFGSIKQEKPFTYQKIKNVRKVISSSFKLKDENRVVFDVGEYDKSKVLTIDPTVNGISPLDFSTVIGGTSDDTISAVEVGNDGKVYVVGTTNSTDFPRTSGMDQDDTDVFISMFSNDGTTLIASTVFGSDGPDSAKDMKFDNANGWVYCTGATANVPNGDSFPTTGTGFDQTENGGSDAFVFIFSPSTNFIIYSSFLGSDFDDVGMAIDLDSAGSFYIAGVTRSGQITVNPFPITSGAFDETHNGLRDVFVTKMNFNGLPNTHVLYSTFIGGNATDVAFDMKLDSNNNAVITGYTTNSGLFGNYPTTNGAFDTSHNGEQDVFITKLNSTGSALLFSTYLGGDATDEGYALTLDQAANVYITGKTRSTTTQYPTTPGAFDRTHNGGTDDLFVSKLNAGGSLLEFSTILGGSRQDIGFAIELDGIGNVLVGGFVESQDYPITLNAYDAAINGNSQAFLTRLNSVGSEVSYSTFIGGRSEDQINDIFLVNSGSVILVGETFLDEFPTTSGAYDTTANGGYDGFVTKFKIPAIQINSARKYDFDGDSKSDISIFRPNVGEWWYLRSSDGGNSAFQFGSTSDLIVPGDYTGDGKTDVAFYRPSNSNWFVLRSEDSTFYSFPFGASGDVPAPGDFDGDGKTDPAVFRASNTTWYISNSSGGTTITGFGVNGDKPAVADYDGDGKDDIAIYRPSNSEWWLNRSSAGVVAYQFGQSGDKTVQGDYTGDGLADVAFFRPSTGFWFVIRSENDTFYSFPFGANGDFASPGDFDGDGTFDAAVFRPTNATWYISGSTNGTTITPFGTNGDKPVPNAYVYE